MKDLEHLNETDPPFTIREWTIAILFIACVLFAIFGLGYLAYLIYINV